MKKLLPIISFLLLQLINLSAQNSDFSDFIREFPEINPQIDSILEIKLSDTINKGIFNYYAWKFQKEPAEKLVFISHGKELIQSSIGKLPVEPFDYYLGTSKKKSYFYFNVYPVGKFSLQPGYICLIIKVIGTELTYFDIYSFTSDGKCLSAMPFAIYGHKNFLDSEIANTKLKSVIEGNKIVSTYYNIYATPKPCIVTIQIKLNEDGIFEVTESNTEWLNKN